MTNRGLLLSVPVPTQTGLTPAGPMQLAGRNMRSHYREWLTHQHSYGTL